MQGVGIGLRVLGSDDAPVLVYGAPPDVTVLPPAYHKRPYVGVSQGTVLGFGDGFGAILWETVAKS